MGASMHSPFIHLWFLDIFILSKMKTVFKTGLVYVLAQGFSFS